MKERRNSGEAGQCGRGWVARASVGAGVVALCLAAGCGSSNDGNSSGTSGSSDSGGNDSGTSGSWDSGGNGAGSSGTTDDGGFADAPGGSGGDSGPEGGTRDAGPRSDVLAIMQKVADWQIAQLGTTNAKTWIEATFYAGLMAAYRTTQQARYLQRLESWGTANQWMLGPRQTNADDQCAGQAYLEAYAIDKAPAELMPTQTELDAMVAAPMPGHAVWSWCDALFMAPGVFARLGAATMQAKYFDAMSTMWWDTASALQDKQDALFWRDATYLNKTCPNGQKMFWSRGNGWVLAGIARVLEYLPQNHPDYAKFVMLLQTMVAKIASLQRPDGYWSSCLTDTQDYPEPETSGTAAFTYAIAWGIHHGVLPAARYGTVASNGWNALVAAVDGNGMLGWVQGVGAAPGPSTATGTAAFGVGLFLLAGSEVADLPP
jgi:rhamnogalacturonyl hydrolase YesR